MVTIKTDKILVNMKRNIFLAILLLATIAFSCTPKEEFVPSDKVLTGDGSIVYNPTATIESFILDEPATKTVLAIDDVTGATFTFAEGDALGVFPTHLEIGNQVSFTVKSSSASSCTFNGGGFGLKQGQYYAAYYPYDSNNSPADPTETELEQIISAIPVDYTNQRQTAVDGTFNISKTDYLVANNITPYDGACNFSMNHIGALVVMDVTLQGEGSATYTELTLSNDKYNFVKTGTVSLFESPSSIVADDQGKTVSLALGKGEKGLRLAAGQTYRFCMMVAPIDLKTDPATVTLSLKDKASGQSHSVVVPAKNFRAGYAYKYACTITAAAAEPDPVPTNLSAVETANTYIVDVNNVNEAGYYFNASVAGNGTGTISVSPASAVYPTGGTSELTKTGASIKTHFNTNNCVSDLAYDATSKTISFKASGDEGVAKISLMDAGGDGIWTWLIWCTDHPGTVTYTNSTNNNTYTVMDRNLGATMSSSSEMQSVNDIPKLCGLYYSWGRPVPLSPDYESNAFGGRAYTWGPDMEQTFKDPDRFTRNSANVFFNYFAFDDSSEKHDVGTLWGDAQNYGGNTTTVSKTIYDPCPAGYKVVPANFMEGYDDTAAKTEFHADPFGVYIDGTNGSAYFPYAGRCLDNGMLVKGDGNSRFTGLNGGDPDCDGCGYWIWTSGHVNGNTSWIAHLAYNNDGRARYGNGRMQLGAPAYACSVRCIVE